MANWREFSYKWLYRFLNQYPELEATYSKQLQTAQYKETTLEKITLWFDAFRSQVAERNYELKKIHNMDETGFALGTTQSTHIIVDSKQKSHWKINISRGVLAAMA